MEKITLSYDEYIKVWQILEELRVSLESHLPREKSIELVNGFQYYEERI